MLKIIKNKHFLFWSCKSKHKKEKVGKAKKGNVVVFNTWKPKVFQLLNISNVSMFLIDCQSYAFLLMNIIISDIFIWL